jgi:hypothetical protein
MPRFLERKLLTADITPVLTSDVTTFDLGDIGAADTFTLTPTRVDTATAGTATGAIAYHATQATLTSNIQTAVRALAGIYADATCANGVDAAHKVLTVLGGYDVTWAVTDQTTFTANATVETTPGKTTYNGTIPIGRFGVIKRIRAEGFADASLDISVIDELSQDVLVKTAIDTYDSGDDPYDKYLTADGVAGEDGAAAANVSSAFCQGPLAVIIATSAPAAEGILAVIADSGLGNGLRLRSTGAFTAASTTVNLGAPFALIKAIRLTSSADTSVAPTITDAYSKNIYLKSSSDYDPAILKQLSHEGVDQAGNAVADLLDVVAKSPITVAQTGLGSGTFKVEFWTEV